MLASIKYAGCDLGQATGGVTPAHMAASNGHTGCLRVLKEAGCDLGMPDLKGKTPAYYATLVGNDDCLRLLQETSCEHTDNNHKSKCCWPWFNTK